MGRVSGKVAIVTGAGSGLGAAATGLLAQEGAKVIATDIDYGSVRKVVGEINTKYPGSGLALKHDVSSKEDWMNAVEAGMQAFGSITVLVNNVSILASPQYDQLAHERSIRTANIDAWGLFIGIQTVAPVMKRAGVGSIVNIASFEALDACGHFTAYAGSKPVVDAFTRATALELAPFNIRVNSIAHGAIQTPMVQNALTTDEPVEDTFDAQSIRRLGRSVDIAHVVLDLSGDDSAFTSVTLHIIDGDLSLMCSVSPIVEQ